MLSRHFHSSLTISMSSYGRHLRSGFSMQSFNLRRLFHTSLIFDGFSIRKFDRLFHFERLFHSFLSFIVKSVMVVHPHTFPYRGQALPQAIRHHHERLDGGGKLISTRSGAPKSFSLEQSRPESLVKQPWCQKTSCLRSSSLQK